MNANTKTILIFMIVYLGSMSILAIGIGYLYYVDEKKSLIENMRLEMRHKVQSINAKLEYYHISESENFNFYDEGYGIGLYDKNKKNIASTFYGDIDFSKFFYVDDEDYYLVESIYKEYLGVKYIVIKKSLPIEKLDSILNHIAMIGLYGFTFLLFVALLLSKIMLYPIRESISILKKFIKDTTHEMNTPISTILMSFDYMEKKGLNSKQLRALDRIEIATKTLSSLYNDLSYVSFHDYIRYKDTEINIKDILLERVKYMTTLIQFKGVTVDYKIEDKIIYMDERKLILLIDNLLSNAIKFSKINGKIYINLNNKFLSIKDSGIGIKKEDQKKIFNRYKSISNGNSGFGIGLDIVSKICSEYDIKIILTSEISKGSEFKLVWSDQLTLRPA